MIVTSVQIKTAKTQKHLYCPVFTEADESCLRFIGFSFCSRKTILKMDDSCEKALFRSEASYGGHIRLSNKLQSHWERQNGNLH